MSDDTARRDTRPRRYFFQKMLESKHLTDTDHWVRELWKGIILLTDSWGRLKADGRLIWNKVFCRDPGKREKAEPLVRDGVRLGPGRRPSLKACSIALSYFEEKRMLVRYQGPDGDTYAWLPGWEKYYHVAPDKRRPSEYPPPPDDGGDRPSRGSPLVPRASGSEGGSPRSAPRRHGKARTRDALVADNKRKQPKTSGNKRRHTPAALTNIEIDTEIDKESEIVPPSRHRRDGSPPLRGGVSQSVSSEWTTAAEFAAGLCDGSTWRAWEVVLDLVRSWRRVQAETLRRLNRRMRGYPEHAVGLILTVMRARAKIRSRWGALRHAIDGDWTPGDEQLREAKRLLWQPKVVPRRAEEPELLGVTVDRVRERMARAAGEKGAG